MWERNWEETLLLDLEDAWLPSKQGVNYLIFVPEDHLFNVLRESETEDYCDI